MPPFIFLNYIMCLYPRVALATNHLEFRSNGHSWLSHAVMLTCTTQPTALGIERWHSVMVLASRFNSRSR
jgi:hypothetical protein